MSFRDATSAWFRRGEDVDVLAATPAVEPAEEPGRFRVYLLCGAVVLMSAGISVAGMYALRSARTTETPPSVVRSEPAVMTLRESAPVAAPAPAPAPAPVRKQALTAAEPPTPPALAAPPRSVSSVSSAAADRLLAKRRYAAALAAYQKLVVAAPRNAHIARGICFSLTGMKDTNRAARACRRAVELDPRDLSARLALARLYDRGGAHKWAAAEYRKIRQLKQRGRS